MKRQRPRIAVAGSLNVDFTFRLRRIPNSGETLSASSMEVHLGGKGANQAVAAARAGAEVSLIGCIGDDEHGIRYRKLLRHEGVETDQLLRVEGATGVAFIAVDERGDNSIIVHPGANARLSIEHIECCAPALTGADALLLQLECPLPAVARAAALAKEAGVRVIVNPSPFRAEAVPALRGADIWIVNQSEFNALRETLDVERYAGEEELRERLGCRALVITKGGDATVLLTEGGRTLLPPPLVTPIDTVGAGDAFAGALAVFLSESRPLEESVRLANVAGALATLQPGAQSSIPHRSLIEHTFAAGL